jgi:tRNA pseudouridine32 synthase/23S rRNA pseudouridine746 synthase
VPLHKNRAPIRVVAPVPAHMRAALEQCGWKKEEANLLEPSFRGPSESEGARNP